MTSRETSRRFWLTWFPSFLGFPLGGLAASFTVGPVQAPLDALLGGALAGAIIGVTQWLALHSLYRVRPVWVLSTALGLALGLTVGIVLFGTATDPLMLLARGFVTGLGVGAAQAFALRTLSFLPWMLAIAFLWALAWPITELVIADDIRNGYAVFGASGALFYTLMSGAMLRTLRRRQV